MSTLTSDSDAAVKAIVSQLVSILPSLYYLYQVCRTLDSYDFRLLLSILILIPVNVAYVVILGRWRYEVNAGIYGKIGQLTAYLAERVSNLHWRPLPVRRGSGTWSPASQTALTPEWRSS